MWGWNVLILVGEGHVILCGSFVRFMVIERIGGVVVDALEHSCDGLG